MGIEGLKTYIEERSKKFLKPFKLYNSYLVIDGSNLMNKLYTSNHCNFSFGGEYNQFAFGISEFFDGLSRCNIIPLVILDGGLEEKKREIVYARVKEKISKINKYSPQDGKSELPFIPLLSSNVFRYILELKGIRCVRTLFEADNEIAAVAKALNCPVLSDDSDFFIFDVMCIPFDTIKSKDFRNVNGSLHCKLFKSDSLKEVFPGFDKKVLPLIAVLLGSDYQSSEIFGDFFSTLATSDNLLQRSPINLSKRKTRIDRLFNWIQHKSMDEAWTQILKETKIKIPLSVFKQIEKVMNHYTTFHPKMLGYLLGTNFNEIPDLVMNLENSSLSAKYLKGIPCCILQKYVAGEYPAFFMDIWLRNPFLNSQQMEDFLHPSTSRISIKIMKVTFKILRSNSTDDSCIIKFIVRGDGTNVITEDLNYNDVHIQDSMIPTLKDLANLSYKKKVNILTGTLEVSENLLKTFLPRWQLYVSAVKYWLDEADPMFVTKCHFYSLIMCFVFYIIEEVIYFQNYLISNVQHKKRRKKNTKTNNLASASMSVIEVLQKVTRKDCLTAQKLFARHMQIQFKSFNRTVIHSFVLFQNCLKQSMYLNDLLDHPFEKVDVARFFSGVMINNFYHDFVKQKELDSYVVKILKDSPNVLQLFVSITTNIRVMLKNNKQV